MGLFDSLSGIFDSGNHDSVLGALGGQFQKYTDPLAWIGGDNYVDLTSHTIPREINRALSTVVAPFDKVDETINPMRKIGFVNDISNVVKDKPASAIGAAVGSIFAAPAIAGAMGAGGAGAAGVGGGASTAIGSAGGSGLFGTGIGGGSLAGGTAAGYGGGVASTALPGILPGATLTGVGSGAGGTFGGALGTGSLTGAAGGMFGPTIGAQGMGVADAMRMANQGRSLMSQQDQEQQRAQQAVAQQQAALGGGGGGNMRGLFSSLMQQPKFGQIAPTAGLLNIRGY